MFHYSLVISSQWNRSEECQTSFFSLASVWLHFLPECGRAITYCHFSLDKRWHHNTTHDLSITAQSVSSFLMFWQRLLACPTLTLKHCSNSLQTINSCVIKFSSDQILPSSLSLLHISQKTRHVQYIHSSLETFD